MSVPTATEMAKALRYLVTQLTDVGLINSGDASCIYDAATNLKKIGASREWHYRLEKQSPLSLRPVFNEKFNTEIRPKVLISIAADSALFAEKGFTLSELRVTLEIINMSNGSLIHRCHIDLSTQNDLGKYQDGPIFHLQFGGKAQYTEETREVFKLREPRSLHPPMDLILFCEMVIANFYPEEWKGLKDRPKWKQLIKDSQELCYKEFFEKATNHLNNGDSLLKSFWASNWDPGR